jgi:hypothetical protein
VREFLEQDSLLRKVGGVLLIAGLVATVFSWQPSAERTSPQEQPSPQTTAVELRSVLFEARVESWRAGERLILEIPSLAYTWEVSAEDLERAGGEIRHQTQLAEQHESTVVVLSLVNEKTGERRLTTESSFAEGVAQVDLGRLD